MGGGRESRCAGRVYSLDGAVRTAPSRLRAENHVLQLNI